MVLASPLTRQRRCRVLAKLEGWESLAFSLHLVCIACRLSNFTSRSDVKDRVRLDQTILGCTISAKMRNVLERQSPPPPAQTLVIYLPYPCLAGEHADLPFPTVLPLLSQLGFILWGILPYT